jgi:hypothetical protein
MKASDFLEWLEKISQLSRVQKEQVKHCLSEVAPQAAVVKWLEVSRVNYPSRSSLPLHIRKGSLIKKIRTLKQAYIFFIRDPISAFT